jgi:ribosome maturation factor RimP
MEIIEKVKELISNTLVDKEIELVDVIYKREGPKMVLRLTLDKKDGITMDECGMVNERLSEILDGSGVINDSYTLEVCSPGLDRLLKEQKDFCRVKGQIVRINTYGPVEDKREHVGKVVDCSDEEIAIELKDGNIVRKIPLGKVSKARLEIEF